MDYKVVIAGGGLAGRSLAYFLSQETTLTGMRILVVDDAEDIQHRSIIYWHDEELPIPLTPTATYRNIAVGTEKGHRVLPLNRHKLCLTSSQQIFASLDNVIDSNPRITRLDARISRIRAQRDDVEVTLSDGRSFRTAYCFDSTSPPPASRAPLIMSGEIRQVQTPRDVFDPSVATFMDFRSRDHQPVHFHCVLPLSPGHALVEVTRITPDIDSLEGWSFEDATTAYLRTAWGVTDFSTTSIQRGIIPLGLPSPAPDGRHLYIGAAAGAVKATTGYGFTRILQQTRHLASSLAATGNPIPFRPPPRFRWYDKPVLNMWKHDPGLAGRFMRSAFTAQDADLILDFLDERTTPLQERAFLGSMPVGGLLHPRLWL